VDRVQQNAGTAGFVTAALLATLFLLILSTGMTPQTALDPDKVIPLLKQKASVFGAIGVLGALAAGFGLVFSIGLFSRLRDRAPTRAAAILGFALVGLTAHALGALMLWRGGALIVAVSAKDQVAANHAWIAANAVAQGLDGLGDGFTGASILVAGWAIVATGAMSASLGWLAVVAGAVTLLQLLSPAPVLFLAGFLLTIVWLAWGGSQLRQPAP
jgi:hypothetical protein